METLQQNSVTKRLFMLNSFIDIQGKKFCLKIFRLTKGLLKYFPSVKAKIVFW